ncbi:MAG: hypothetical protein KDD66_06750 [Bdellovibrionales bacterium]|nr:hypothetical protein [Bdellovibrionales bacterium]
MGNFRFTTILSAFSALTVIFAASPAVCDGNRKPPRTAFNALTVFSGEKHSPMSMFNGRFSNEVKVVDVSEKEKEAPEAAPEAKAVEPDENAKSAEPEQTAEADEAAADSSTSSDKDIVFVGDDPTAHILPPDQDVPLRFNKDAPSSFVAMARAHVDGDHETARAYARQFVRYQKNMLFEVRELTKLIGAALVEEGVIDEEDWDGVEQYLNWEFANSREETGAVLKATHEDALKRIKADPNHQAEIYYFFTINSSWARTMAPDVERLWQVAQRDPNIKMVALSMGPLPNKWVESYRNYTGLTVPIFEGAEVAKSFDVAFTPALVVVSPTTKTAYRKTGQQSFQRMYEFVRTVQGKSTEISPQLASVLNKPIGEVEKLSDPNGTLPNGGIVVYDSRASGEDARGSLKRVNHLGSVKRKPKKNDALERF